MGIRSIQSEQMKPVGAGWYPPTINEGSSTNGSFSDLINPDGDGINYRLGVWNSNGSCVVTSDGWVQMLLVGGGAQGVPSYMGGGGGGIVYGTQWLVAGTHTVTIGTGGSGGWYIGRQGTGTVFGPFFTPGSYYGQASGIGQGYSGTSMFTTRIRGIDEGYGQYAASSPRANFGDGGAQNPTNGSSGRAIIRWRTN